jgi:hypothetical protein
MHAWMIDRLHVDVTIASLMSALGVGITALPGYASNVVMELRQNTTTEPPSYFVTIVYNNTAQAQVVHAFQCPQDQEHCAFDLFVAGAQANFVDDPESLCRTETLSDSSVWVGRAVYMVIGMAGTIAIEVVIGVIGAAIFVWHRRRNKIEFVLASNDEELSEVGTIQ